MASEKNAMRKEMTSTPRAAVMGVSSRTASRACCMKLSLRQSSGSRESIWQMEEISGMALPLVFPARRGHAQGVAQGAALVAGGFRVFALVGVKMPNSFIRVGASRVCWGGPWAMTFLFSPMT